MTYLPEHFAQNDRDEIGAFLRTYPFGTVVVTIGEDLWPTPLPLIHRPATTGWGSFIGHVARNNPMWEAERDREVLIIINGPDTYITPNWYATKAETHKVVPTWNYTAVHAWGKMKVHHEPKFKRMAVGLLTRTHEQGSPNPWKMGDAPQDYLADQLDHIVGIEIEITKLKAKWKLSQNRTEADRTGVIAGLSERNRGNDRLIRDAMQDHNDR